MLILTAILIVGIVVWILFSLACLGANSRDYKIVYGIMATTTFVLLLVGASLTAFV